MKTQVCNATSTRTNEIVKPARIQASNIPLLPRHLTYTNDTPIAICAKEINVTAISTKMLHTGRSAPILPQKERTKTTEGRHRRARARVLIPAGRPWAQRACSFTLTLEDVPMYGALARAYTRAYLPKLSRRNVSFLPRSRIMKKKEKKTYQERRPAEKKSARAREGGGGMKSSARAHNGAPRCGSRARARAPQPRYRAPRSAGLSFLSLSVRGPGALLARPISRTDLRWPPR